MGNSTDSVIENDSSELKLEEMILDKKGNPMSDEQIEYERGMLLDMFRIQFFFHRDPVERMVDYDEDAKHLHFENELLIEKYRYVMDLIRTSKKHCKVYSLEHIYTEKQKKQFPEKKIKRNEKMIVDHLTINRQYRHDLKIMAEELKRELIARNMILPEWNSVDKNKKSKFNHSSLKMKVKSNDIRKTEVELGK